MKKIITIITVLFLFSGCSLLEKEPTIVKDGSYHIQQCHPDSSEGLTCGKALRTCSLEYRSTDYCVKYIGCNSNDEVVIDANYTQCLDCARAENINSVKCRAYFPGINQGRFLEIE